MIMENKNKIMGCTPDGKMQVTSEIFNFEYFDVLGELTDKLDMKERLQIRLKYAEYCIDEYMESVAFNCYTDILEEVIVNNKIKRGYEDIAKKAYYGLLALSHSNNDFTWESCEGYADAYKHLFKDL